ncbi:amino acid permease/ SLC12A domain-containing protein [Linnemannia elongata]|nr:amino acid permease/ SLC12A domain-containing protein [Linnemannia elongata]
MSKTEYGEQMESYEGQPTYSEKIESTEVIESHNNELTTASGEGGLQRNLQARHLTMISLGGTIGTGLFLASGSSISVAGPGYALIAYGLIGTMVYCFMSSLGEMTTYMPITGSINAYGTRFVDPAFGFMLGWVYWFSWSITLAAELVAAGLIISYWVPVENCPGWVWALVFIVVLTSLNLTTVKAYGETEYWLSLIKVLAVAVFIIVGFLYIGGAVGKGFIEADGSVAPQPGAAVFNMGPFHGGFAGLASIFLNAGFSFQGAELVGIAAGETKNPRKNVPRAIRQVFWRILLFYILTITIIGFCIPYNDPILGNADGNIASSPFTRVFVRAGIKIGGDIMNAVILVAILSAGNSGLYASSRALHTLSKEGSAPKFFGYVNRWGVPVYCVLATSLVGCLAFIVSLPQIGQGEAYNWLLSLSSTTGFVAWVGIAVNHIRFRMAYKAQGRNIKDLPFISHLYPFGPIYTILICAIILLGQGYTAFSPFSIKAFLSAYITLPFVVLLYLGNKFWCKTKILKLVDVDLDTGRSFIDITMNVDDTASQAEKKNSSWWKKIVHILA